MDQFSALGSNFICFISCLPCIDVHTSAWLWLLVLFSVHSGCRFQKKGPVISVRISNRGCCTRWSSPEWVYGSLQHSSTSLLLFCSAGCTTSPPPHLCALCVCIWWRRETKKWQRRAKHPPRCFRAYLFPWMMQPANFHSYFIPSPYFLNPTMQNNVYPKSHHKRHIHPGSHHTMILHVIYVRKLYMLENWWNLCFILYIMHEPHLICSSKYNVFFYNYVCILQTLTGMNYLIRLSSAGACSLWRSENGEYQGSTEKGLQLRTDLSWINDYIFNLLTTSFFIPVLCQLTYFTVNEALKTFTRRMKHREVFQMCFMIFGVYKDMNPFLIILICWLFVCGSQ